MFGLPAKTSVSSILSEYAKHAEKNQLENAFAIVEIMSGLKGLYPLTTWLLTPNIYNEFKKSFWPVTGLWDVGSLNVLKRFPIYTSPSDPLDHLKLVCQKNDKEKSKQRNWLAE